MNNLVQHQQWLQTAITQVQVQSDTTTRPVSDYLQSTENLSASHRLHIYQSSYRARILQSFHAIFPGLLTLLGAELLDAFVLDFIGHRAPRHFSINRIADDFVEHLQNTSPAETPTDNWSDLLIDMAALELNLLEISEAEGLENCAQSSSNEITALSDLSDAKLLQCRPQVAPCLRLLHCHYPVHQYLHQLQLQKSESMTKALDNIEPPAAREVYLGLTRVNYRLSTRELAAPQWHLLRLCKEQNTVAQALEKLAQLSLFPRADIDLLRLWLGNFLNQGFIAQLT